MAASRIGKYRVTKPLAMGGMGETLLALDGHDELVVLKRLLPHLAGDPEAVRCFREERRIAARLDHPNVVRYLDVVEERDEVVLVFEFVDGCSARDLLADARARKEPIPVADACALVEAAARGLHYAHCLSDEAGNPLGLIHRDVSPANILISVHGDVKLIDFGVAKAWDAEGRTATGIVKGKVGYMSPEQALCEPLDARADVFALGVVLWELLVGDRLFMADGPMATAYQVLEAPIPKPSAKRPGIPARIDAICLHALERDRDRRTESAHSLEQSLADWRQQGGAISDLGALVHARVPDRPSLAPEVQATRLARPRSTGEVPTQALEATAALSAPGPLAPAPAPDVVPLAAARLPSEDLSSTRFDTEVADNMRTVRRRGVLRRAGWLLAGVLLASLASLALRQLPDAHWPGAASRSLDANVLFAYTDSGGTEVIVASLADVPEERRPSARRIDLAAAPVSVTPNAGVPAVDGALGWRALLELGGPAVARPQSPGEVLQGLFVPLVALLLGAALLFALLALLHDGFVRWTLRLLVLFVVAVGLTRMLADGVLGRPGFRSLGEGSNRALPVNRLAPEVQEWLKRATGAGAGAMGYPANLGDP